ncbi:ATPase [Elizabethkingia meningoseptica]|uniref:ATPase n=1 Tax=Elizabethkingia meningoseptica TaxID=238 RepID=A0A1T3HZS7_ELIME|nr:MULTISPECIES: BadF/BadG/BcrA/BcrD ATPase family protein [Elizabethkingia]AQX12327.1 ATPase [Elizabethkingia meningoseptica]MBG0513856.1 ATPase [Elizabethkingia meningoseptica]MDE5436301.1 ATPase [Elizabethkingia meningoseptica]MDE5447983.1 ATPase [Elizabethkingia meningoseptica]MDE5473165.1 ATPase [Elizabethkingia meningoseptica]
MIAIVDGGSTKCDWVILKASGEEVLRTATKGFNPNNTAPHLIPTEIHKNEDLERIKEDIQHIFFYGSGCGVEENCKIVEEQLQKVFTKAQILVKEDLLGAAYAVYRGKPVMVCILGTGSNSCYFDGKDIKVELPSLGFLLGDDGAGSSMGKRIVKNFFMKKLPPSLEREFRNEYPELTIELLLQKMYHENTMVNAYFAEFNKFVAKWKEHPFVQNLIFEEFKNYIEFQLLPYGEIKDAEISFIGSIAYVYGDILKTVTAQYNLNFGIIVQRPIVNLVQYHVEHIFPTLK